MNGRSRKHTRAAQSLASEMMLAPMVAMMRLPMLAREAAEPLSAAKETLEAVSEKAAAAAEGMVGAQMSYLDSMMRFWPEVLSGRTPSVLSGIAVERSLHAALAPSGKRVKANYRRLSRKRA